jgi:hypothetical protein
MAKLQDNTKVYGSLTVDGILTAGVGTGFSNIVVFTTGTSYTLPSILQVAGLKFKVTLIGGGGAGGSSSTSTGTSGNGGGSGALCVVIITVVAGVYTFSYTIGAGGTGTTSTGNAGSSTTLTYNSVTYTAGAGSGGGSAATLAGTANGGSIPSGGLLNIAGNAGKYGGTSTSGYSCYPFGGDTPLGYGFGGVFSHLSTGGAGLAGSGYGSGGAGGRAGTGTTNYSGGDGAPGIIILEY